MKELSLRINEELQKLSEAQAPSAIWNRDVSFWGKTEASAKESIRTRLGWLDSPTDFSLKVSELTAFANEIRQERFTDVVLLGMGGSSLSVEVLRDIFGVAESFPKLQILDSTHPDQIAALEASIDLAHTLFIVSSKSGSTIEPDSFLEYFWNRVTTLGVPHAGGHFCAITDPGSLLVSLGAKREFRRVFLNPTNIGGRFSVLSYFGLVPAALMGIDIRLLLDRALEAANNSKTEGAKNIALRLGVEIGVAANLGRDKLTVLLPKELTSFGHWLEQLIAESTGKEKRGVLPVVGEGESASAAYGEDRFFVGIDLVGGTAISFPPDPCFQMSMQDKYDLGAQFFIWEFAIAVIGKVIEVNPFDEPNVTESKQNSLRVLEDFRKTGTIPDSGTVIDGVRLRTDIQGNTIQEVVHAFLEASVKPGCYIALMAYIEMSKQSEDALTKIRSALEQRYHVPVTLGFGPRFLHSTGQLHKGGPAEGVFIQFTDTPKTDLAIPGKDLTFGTLIKAQAAGDRQSIEKRARPLISFGFERGTLASLEKLLPDFS
jgi:transaldolase/glucose-6-phosphate isomerase